MYRVEKQKVIAYHCLRCGGTADPNTGLCPYCSQELHKWHESQNHKVRMLVGNQYIADVCEIAPYEPQHEIEVTSLSDNVKTYITGIVDTPDIDVSVYYTRHTIEQLDYMERYEQEVKFEILGNFDKVFTFHGVPRISNTFAEVGKPVMVNISFSPRDVQGWGDLKVPDNLICPNCGAEIKSRFGCCEFCGGWVEWIR